jgi:hypothetical protein
MHDIVTSVPFILETRQPAVMWSEWRLETGVYTSNKGSRVTSSSRLHRKLDSHPFLACHPYMNIHATKIKILSRFQHSASDQCPPLGTTKAQSSFFESWNISREIKPKLNVASLSLHHSFVMRRRISWASLGIDLWKRASYHLNLCNWWPLARQCNLIKENNVALREEHVLSPATTAGATTVQLWGDERRGHILLSKLYSLRL